MNSEIGEYFGINGSAVSGAIKRIEEMQGQAEKLRSDLFVLKEQVLNVK